MFLKTIANNYILLIAIAQLLIPVAIIALALYFLIIKPQNKQREKQELITSKLKPGTIVTTNNNIKGHVIYVLKNTVIIESKIGEKIEILKQSITTASHNNKT